MKIENFKAYMFSNIERNNCQSNDNIHVDDPIKSWD